MQGGRGGERRPRDNAHHIFYFSDFFRFLPSINSEQRGLPSYVTKETTRAIKPATGESDTHTHTRTRARPQRVKPKRKNVLFSTIILLPHFSIVSARTVERFVVFVFLVVFVFDDERSVAILQLDLFGGTERFPASPADARRTFGPRSHFYQFVRQARSVH